MQRKTEIFNEDMEYIVNAKYIPWEKLKNKTILVTGGTGLIGSELINALLYANIKENMNISIVAIVRDIKYAKKKFENVNIEYLKFYEGTVENLPSIEEDINYIIHGASPTASDFFVEYPVETIRTAVCGTMNLLELAKKKQTDGFVYMSSMEVYGEILTEDSLTEDMCGYINPLSVRSSYPESKRMCEAMCSSYAKEYGMQITIVRLAQTFGPGVTYDDKRVFAMMARCVIEGKDIILQTKGASKRQYLYTAQAITAILTVLLKGKSGGAYNASNPATYCSVYEMGLMVAENIGKGNIHVIIDEGGNNSKYMSFSYLNLDITAIRELGWCPEGNLEMMYKRLIESM